jgi:hypothetical protein
LGGRELAEVHLTNTTVRVRRRMLDEGIDVTIPKKRRRNIEVERERFHCS